MNDKNEATVVETEDITIFDKLRGAVMEYVFSNDEEALPALHDIESIIRQLEDDYKNLEDDRDRYHEWWHDAYTKLKAYELITRTK